jgi:hypothetical protein
MCLQLYEITYLGGKGCRFFLRHSDLNSGFTTAGTGRPVVLFAERFDCHHASVYYQLHIRCSGSR